jgi:hypothetical protein
MRAANEDIQPIVEQANGRVAKFFVNADLRFR